MRGPLFWLLFALFILVNTVNALHKGGDFEVFVEGGQRVRDAAPLYRDSSPGQGVIGPPFQSVFFVPAAWLWERSETAARLLWYLVGLTTLVGGVWLWGRALRSNDHSGPPEGPGSWPMLLTFGAISLPVQTNFEHQNLNTVLLCATGGAAWALARGHQAVGGALVGAATAVKAFPGLLLLYLLARRRSQAAAVGVVTAALLTFSPAFWYGPGAAAGLWTDWLAINRDGGWPMRLQNQSLFAAWSRLTVDGAFPLFLLSAAVLAGILLHTAWRQSKDSSSSSADLPKELALALMTAVLVSPIAWDHYWVLMFPGFLLVARRLWGQGKTAGWFPFGLAAVLVSGFSPLVAGASGFDAVREGSGYTIAGVVIVTMTAAFIGASDWGDAGGQKKRPE